MSYFIPADKVIIQTVFEFGPIVENTINQFQCKNGEIAGFELFYLEDFSETGYPIVRIYDSTTGDSILKGVRTILPGMDLTGGLFSSGVIPDRDITDPECRFFRVDYV